MANEWGRKTYSGGVGPTTLNGAINNSVTSIVVTSGSAFPDGSLGPFVISVDRTTLVASEEKMLCTSRSGNTLTVIRAYDGTPAASHLTLASVEHVNDAFSMDQANAIAAAAATVGQIPYRSGTLAYAGVTPGASGLPLMSNGAGVAPAYSALPIAGISAGAQAAIIAGLATVAAMNAADTALAARSGFGISRNAVQAIGSGATAAIAWDTEGWDSAGYFAPTNTNIAIPAGTNGLYLVTCQITSSGTANAVAAEIMLDGISQHEFMNIVGTSVITGVGHLWATTLLVCGVGSVLSVNVKNGTGGSLNFTGKFSAHKISN